MALEPFNVNPKNIDEVRQSIQRIKTNLTQFDLRLLAAVVGPASATDNAVARFDTATGKLIQNSGVLIDDSNNVSGVNTLDIGASPPAFGDTLNVDGSMDLRHLAAEDDEHALEIECDAAGFSDVKALEIDYITGAIVTGEFEEAILINFDETAALGGDVSGIEIISTEGGADNINGMFVGATINPIRQLSGVFTNADSIDEDGNDVLVALSTGGAGNIAIFTLITETMTVGSSTKFEEIEAILDTGASGAGIKPTFEFSTGSGTWASFGPTDGTDGFKHTGVIVWTDGEIPSWATGVGAEYLIRITRTRVNLATTPIIDKLQISIDTEFSWNKDGDVTIHDLSATGDIAVSGTVDSRDVNTDGTKLDTIETSATADQTDAEIRTAVEAATDSNVFTDADHTKLNAIGIEIPYSALSYQDGTARPDRTGTTGQKEWWVNDFAVDEFMIFLVYMPTFYANGGLTIPVLCAMTTAITGNVKLESSIERIGTGTTQNIHGASGFATGQNSGDVVVAPTTAGNTFVVTITHATGSEMDSWVAGEWARLQLKRIAATSSEASGDLEMVGFPIKET